MTIKKLVILNYLLFFSCAFASELSADDILIKVMDRMKGVDYSFEVSIKKQKKGKLDKNQIYKFSLLYPVQSRFSNISYIQTLAPKNLQDVKFWEYKFKDGSQPKRWMTMPVTGKLKDMTDKKPNKSEFNFSDLEISLQIINDSNNKIIDNVQFNKRDVFVVESIDKRSKEVKKIWIDKNEFFVLKSEFYTKSGRKSKVIKVGDLSKINNIIFPKSIEIKDLRRKTKYNLEIYNFELKPDYNLNEFYPIGIKVD